MAGGDKEHRGGGGRDAFLHSLDRVPSGLHIDADFPSDDDDDDEEEVRVSFASAMGDHKMHSFRRHQAAVLEEDEDEDDLSKYDMWMSDEHMTIQERRRRLHQGLGLASSRDLALRRHSTRKRMVDIPRSVSKMPPLPSPAATAAAPTTAAAAPAPRPSARDMLMQRPAKPITRRRSDGFLATRDGGVSAGGSGKPPPPSPSVRRVRSLPARHAGCDDVSLVEKFRNAVAKRDLPAAMPPPAAAAAAVPVVKGRTGDGGSGGKDRDDAAKNQESSKEVAVVPTPKDAGASNTQTGVQLGLEEIEKFIGNTPIVKHLMRRGQSQHHSGQLASPSGGAPPKAEKPAGGKKKGGWLKNIKSVAIGFIQDKDSSSSSKSTPSTTTSSAANATSSSSSSTASSSERLKVHQSGKSCKELTGLYMCQEIMAHEGSIWSIKFSTDGRWLASAGEDHVVRIWQVVEARSPACTLPNDGNSGPLPPQPPGATAADGTSSTTTPALSQLSKKSVKGKSGRDTLPEHLVVPDKVFALADQPACVLEGHQDDVLDLTWSKFDQLLSSSMDKTVRLWDTTTKACLKVFAHNDYVTCIQFNPVDDRYFISGSLDAKVRLWSIPDRQVVDWTDLNEMVTAASYTPDGQGAIIGSHKGSCRFYKTTDCKLNQEAQIDIQTKKRKSQAKKITGFQFAPGNPSEVLVTSADSQIRVFDGVTMVQKFRGFKNTSSQISAAYTSDGRYVVCASEDSHVYLWRAARGAPPAAAAIGGIGMKPKTWCTIRSFENFYCKDVSAAVPWPLAPSAGGGGDGSTSGCSPSRRQGVSCTDDVCSMPAKSGELGNAGTPLTHSGQLGSAPGGGKGGGGADGNAWGLVVVTASLHGEIRVYQNFGMPFRIRGQGNLFY